MNYKETDKDFEKLLNEANGLVGSKQINKKTVIGKVAAAVLSADGKIYSGICIETTCSLGCCAEMVALGEMVKDGKTKVSKMVVIHENEGIISPCGKCRELLFQINHENLKCEIFLKRKKVLLIELLPEY